MKKRAPRRVFSTEYKMEIVKRTMHPGTNVAAVARDIGITKALLYKWRKQFMPTLELIRDADGQQEAEQEDIVKLKYELDFMKRMNLWLINQMGTGVNQEALKQLMS